MSPDVLRLRRAVRALLRQGGGSMLTRLPESGVTMRLECAMTGDVVAITALSLARSAAELVAHACPGVRLECERVGCRLDRMTCARPALADALNRAA